jgi:hypothetical protein
MPTSPSLIKSLCQAMFEKRIQISLPRPTGSSPIQAMSPLYRRFSTCKLPAVSTTATPIDPALWLALKNEQLVRADAPTP